MYFYICIFGFLCLWVFVNYKYVFIYDHVIKKKFHRWLFHIFFQAFNNPQDYIS